jgi:thymidylate synthase (FAD)
MRRLNEEFRMKQMKLLSDTQEVYDWALSNNIAKEQARAVLPEGLTMSTLIMTGSVRSWVHYIDVRAGEDTQKEHRDIAKAAQSILLNNFPSLGDYWND